MGPAGPRGQTFATKPLIPGFKGPNGEDGPDGLRGPDGPDGEAGVRGQDGVVGRAGIGGRKVRMMIFS